MTVKRYLLTGLLLSASLGFAQYLHAEIVAEWKFDGTSDLAGGTIVPLDSAVAKASTQSLLMPDSSVMTASTGLGDKWVPFLAAGYLETGNRTGPDSKGTCGLVTKNTALPENAVYPGGDASYKEYMGFTGLGSGTGMDAVGGEALQGGTIYLVVSPNSSWISNRCGIMGTGHIGGGVSIIASKGEMVLRVGQSGSAGHATQASITNSWEPNKWYFIAASWTSGQPPVLYVREMDQAGAPSSPAALTGSALGAAPEGLKQPEYDPYVIGATWINTGADTSRYTQDGADARIAYVRIDNTAATAEDMGKVFLSLASQ